MEAVLEYSRPTAVRSLSLPKTSRLAVTTLFFINGALFGSWVSRIPAVQSAHGLSDGVLGLALLAMALGALIAMPLAGWASARFGSHRISQSIAVLYAGLLPVLALAPSGAALVIALFGFGAGHGGLDVGMNAQAVAVEKRCRRSIMSSFHALFSVGGLAGAMAGGLLAAAGVAPWAHFAGVAVLLLGAAVLTYPHLLDDRERSVAHPAASHRPSFALPNSALCALGALAFCAMMGEGAMADWSAIYLRRALGSGEGFAAAGYAAFSIAMAVTRFSGDRLSMLFGPVNLVRLSGVVVVSGLGLALLSPHPAAALIGFACVGAGFATVVPMAFSAAGRAPGISPGVAMASVTTLGYFGFLIGPPIIGFAAEMIGLRSALAILFLTSTLIIVLGQSVRSASAHH